MQQTFSETELNGTIPSLRRFAISLTRNEDKADDLVQDSIERALRKADYFQPGTNLRSWMFTLCKRIFLNQVRKKKTRGRTIELDDAPQTQISAPASQEDICAYRNVANKFERLPARDRTVLSLVAIEGLKYEETAAVLDIPVGTVRSRLSRARMRLKELTEQGGRESRAAA